MGEFLYIVINFFNFCELLVDLKVFDIFFLGIVMLNVFNL